MENLKKQESDYVVLGDMYFLLNEWVKEKQFVLPNKIFFSSIRKDFSESMKKIFPRLIFISEDQIIGGMNYFLSHYYKNYETISLCPTYIKSTLNINLTRMIQSPENKTGIFSRFGCSNLLTQLTELKKLNLKKVMLVDDVIFTGSLLSRIILILRKMGIEDINVIAGVGTKQGVSKIRSLGCCVDCVIEYLNETVDVLCERDFYPGMPYCGRSVKSYHDTGVPYIKPFGMMNEWASIPKEHEESLSRFLIEQTIKIFEEIEKVSYPKKILYNDIDRKISYLGHCYGAFGPIGPERSFVEILESYLEGKSQPCDQFLI